MEGDHLCRSDTAEACMTTAWEFDMSCRHAGNGAALTVLRPEGGSAATIPELAGAAAFGAVCGAVVATPMEMVKCNAQADTLHAAGLVAEWRTLVRIVSTGGALSLFRGCALHCTAGLLSMPVWFVSNELMLRQRASRWRGRDRVPWREKLLCGAVGGVLSWVPAYPWDKMKTLWQTSPGGSDSMLSFMRNKLRQEGAGFLYRGFSATLVRAFPQTGMTIAMYDLARGRLLL